MLQSYVKRLEDLENIANGFNGVEKSYAIQAGRDLRIIVDSQKVRDEETTLLSRDIAKAIEELRHLKNEEPTYAPARIALGVLHYGNGNVLEAQAEWEKVLMKDPFHAEASMYLNLSRTATETNLKTT